MTNEPCLRTPPTTAQLSQRTLCSKVYNEARLSDIMLVWWPGRVTVVLELGCEQMLRRTREAPDASKREERPVPVPVPVPVAFFRRGGSSTCSRPRKK